MPKSERITSENLENGTVTPVEEEVVTTPVVEEETVEETVETPVPVEEVEKKPTRKTEAQIVKEMKAEQKSFQQQVDEAPKVNVLIPLADNESPGATAFVRINGVGFNLLKGKMIELSKIIYDNIKDSHLFVNPARRLSLDTDQPQEMVDALSEQGQTDGVARTPSGIKKQLGIK